MKANIAQAAQLAKKLKADGFSKQTNGQWKNQDGRIAEIKRKAGTGEFEIIHINALRQFGL